MINIQVLSIVDDAPIIHVNKHGIPFFANQVKDESRGFSFYKDRYTFILDGHLIKLSLSEKSPSTCIHPEVDEITADDLKRILKPQILKKDTQ